jgi:glucokinase
MTHDIPTSTPTHTYLGIDIGGTHTRIGLFKTLATPYYTPLARFPTQQSYQQQLRMLLAALAGAALEQIEGIGVSIGGRMAKDGRSVLVAPNLPDYVGQPCAADLEHRYSCPTYLAHDTVCGLLGEKKFGPLSNIDRCAYLTLSTGTGAAFQLRTGPTALTVSIEIGHQLLDGNTRACLCGQVGCLETYTGGKQLEAQLGHPLTQETDEAFWETFSEKLALGLVNLANLTRVEAIAIGGAILLNNPTLLPLLQQNVATRLRGASLQLYRAALAENAPLVGAALLLETPSETIVH